MNKELQEMINSKITSGATFEKYFEQFKDYLVIRPEDFETICETINQERYYKGFCAGFCGKCIAHNEYSNGDEILPNNGYGTLKACNDCKKQEWILTLKNFWR